MHALVLLSDYEIGALKPQTVYLFDSEPTAIAAAVKALVDEGFAKPTDDGLYELDDGFGPRPAHTLLEDYQWNLKNSEYFHVYSAVDSRPQTGGGS